MKSSFNLKSTLFITGIVLMAGSVFLPGVTTRSFASSANAPVVITTPPTIVITVTTTPPPPPGPCVDAYVRKTSNVTQVTPGQTIEFTIVAGNNCPTPAVNVQVRDTLPSYLDLVSVNASPRGTVIQSGNSFIVDIGTLPQSEVITITVVARLNATAQPGACQNVATLNTTSDGDNPDNNISFATWVCGPPPVIPPTGGSGEPIALPLAVMVIGGLLIVASLFIRQRKAA